MRRYGLLLAVLFCVAATVPPVPKLKQHHRSAAVERGAGAKALIKPMVVAVPVVNTFVWQYPSSVNPSNLWWNIETSSDLRSWSVAVSNASGVTTVNVNKQQPLQVYRLAGRLTP